MATWTPLKRDVLDSLADEFLHNYSRGRTILAIDGVDGSGTSRFADDLADRLARGSHAVFRASIDDFHRPKADRDERGADTPAGYYAEGYDYSQFRRALVEPFKLGGSAGFVLGAWDLGRDIPIEMDWKTGPVDATLVVDGPFLQRPELRGLWNWTLWLEAEQQVATPAEELYLAEVTPRGRASAIVDNTDPDVPRRVFADSC